MSALALFFYAPKPKGASLTYSAVEEVKNMHCSFFLTLQCQKRWINSCCKQPAQWLWHPQEWLLGLLRPWWPRLLPTWSFIFGIFSLYNQVLMGLVGCSDFCVFLSSCEPCRLGLFNLLVMTEFFLWPICLKLLMNEEPFWQLIIKKEPNKNQTSCFLTCCRWVNLAASRQESMWQKVKVMAKNFKPFFK